MTQLAKGRELVQDGGMMKQKLVFLTPSQAGWLFEGEEEEEEEEEKEEEEQEQDEEKAEGKQDEEEIDNNTETSDHVLSDRVACSVQI